MYKVVIADDEKMVLEGLKNTFNWEKYNFEVCGLAETGKEAFKIIEQTKCHVLITDIRMPDMDGLELARKMKDNYPYVHIIIISAYSDFDYAQQAIKYGVSGYLLKPLKDVELIELLLKIKAEIELMELMELRKLNNNLNLNKVELNKINKEAILKKMLNGNYNWNHNCDLNKDLNENNENSNMQQYLVQYNLTFLKEPIRIALCNIEYKDGATASLFRKIAFNTILLLLDEMNIPSLEYAGFIVIFLNNSINLRRSIAFSIIYEYKCLFKSELQKICMQEYNITIGVSNLHSKGINLNRIFSEALNAYKQKFFLGPDRLIFYEDLNMKSYSDLNKEECNKIVNKIVNNIFIGEEKELFQSIDSFFLYIESKGNFVVEDVKTKIIEVIFNINHAVKDAGNMDIISAKGDIINDIQRMASYNYLKKWFIDMISNLFKKVRLYSYGNSNWMVQKAIHYVRANIAKKVTLDDVADYLHVNASYFSYTFKKSTDQNFIDYVTESKIQEAKYLLLNSTLKIKEISSKVGYNDYSYFCKMFKKMEDTTPLEYRMKGVKMMMDEK